MYQRCESVRAHGEEILRARVVMRKKNGEIPVETENFYDELAEKYFEAMKNTLSERAAAEFEAWRGNGGAKKFGKFARVNACVEFEFMFSADNDNGGKGAEYMCVLTDVKISRHGKNIFFERRSDIWELDSSFLVPKKRALSVFVPKSELKTAKRKFMGRIDGIFFDGNEAGVFANSSPNAPIVQKTVIRERIVN